MRHLDKDGQMKLALSYLEKARTLMADAADQDHDDPDPIGICMAIDDVGENLENMIIEQL